MNNGSAHLISKRTLKREDTPIRILILQNEQSKNVTFPEPKNPVMMVAGIRSSGGIFVSTSEPSLCVVWAATAENRRRSLWGLEETPATATILLEGTGNE